MTYLLDVPPESWSEAKEWVKKSERILCGLSFYANARTATLTCEVSEAQLLQAVVPVSPVVEEDGQRVASLVQFGASDDAQVLQRQLLELVESHQHVAGHFSDWLQRIKEEILLHEKYV